jgi:methylated-DNA-[protein]-cysteine S-methyltransferase
MPTYYRILETAFGHVGFVATPRGLRRVYLPEGTRSAIVRTIARDFPDATEKSTALPDLAAALQAYFAGQPVKFQVKLDTSGTADFAAAVWQACRKIPYGQTASYGELARCSGRPGAARAVGTVMSRNPFPIVVPCHRVVKSDGRLGGYSGCQGVAFKQTLLDMERAAGGAV